MGWRDERGERGGAGAARRERERGGGYEGGHWGWVGWFESGRGWQGLVLQGETKVMSTVLQEEEEQGQ